MNIFNPLGLHGVGLDTFWFGNAAGDVTPEIAAKLTHAFLDGGGTYIQTAPYYEGVEPLLGGILSAVPRQNYRLATLCVKNGDMQLSGKREAIMAQCNESLLRLGLDYVDLLMTATPDAAGAPLGETIQAMHQLKDAGKIRAIGVRDVTLKQLKEYDAGGAVDYVQNRLNLIDQEAGRELRQYCVQRAIGLIPYDATDRGLLTSRIMDRWVRRDNDPQARETIELNDQQQAVLHDWMDEHVRPIANEYKAPIEALAICWTLEQLGVVACPVSPMTMEQLASSLEVAKLLGRPELISKLQRVYGLLRTTVQARYGKELSVFFGNSAVG